LDHFIADSRI